MTDGFKRDDTLNKYWSYAMGIADRIELEFL